MGPHGRTIAYVDQEMARRTAVGLDELAHVEAELEGVPVERVVRFGEPAEEIRLEAEAFNADLVTLAMSRRSRLGSALRPGVAERVVQEAPVPTLVLRDLEVAAGATGVGDRGAARSRRDQTTR